MSQDDPMSLFTRSLAKKEKAQPPSSLNSSSKAASPTPLANSHPEEAKALSAKSQGAAKREIEELPVAPLPENWREKLAEICQKLTEMQRLGREVPQRHNMSEHEFETYLNNPANFDPEDWAMISKARQRTRDFIAQMKSILGRHQGQDSKKKAKTKKGVSRSWISVD